MRVSFAALLAAASCLLCVLGRGTARGGAAFEMQRIPNTRHHAQYCGPGLRPTGYPGVPRVGVAGALDDAHFVAQTPGWVTGPCKCRKADGTAVQSRLYIGGMYALEVCGNTRDGACTWMDDYGVGHVCDHARIPLGGGFIIKSGHSEGEDLLGLTGFRNQEWGEDLEPINGATAPIPAFRPGARHARFGSQSPARNAPGCIRSSDATNSHCQSVLRREARCMVECLQREVFIMKHGGFRADAGIGGQHVRQGTYDGNNGTPWMAVQGDWNAIDGAIEHYQRAERVFVAEFCGGAPRHQVVPDQTGAKVKIFDPHGAPLEPAPRLATFAGASRTQRTVGEMQAADAKFGSASEDPNKYQPGPFRLAVCDLVDVDTQQYGRRSFFDTPRAADIDDAAAWAKLKTPGRGKDMGIFTAAILNAALRGMVPPTRVYWAVSTYANTWEKQGLGV